MKIVLLVLTELSSTKFGRLSVLLSRVPLTSNDTLLVHLKWSVCDKWSTRRALNFVHSFYTAVVWLNLPAAFRIVTGSIRHGRITPSFEALLENVDTVVVDCEPRDGLRRLSPFSDKLKARLISFVDVKNIICDSRDPKGNLLTKDKSIDHEMEEEKEDNDELEKYKSVAVGGTFDRMHVGHEMLLTSAALLAQSLTVGVTTETMLHNKCLSQMIQPLQQRISTVEKFLKTVASDINVDVVPINDVYGPTITNAEMDCLVITEDSVDGAAKVTKARADLAFPVMKIVEVKLVETLRGSQKLCSSSTRKALLGELISSPAADYSAVRPYVIGLTGGIASGKSTIGSYLSEWGAHVIDCDRVGHRTYMPGTATYAALIKEFGMEIVGASVGSEIDRKVLGKIVFADESKRERLNQIVWPEIARLVQEEIAKLANSKRVVVLEAAVLLDAGWHSFVHEIWLTFVPHYEAIQRVIRRTNCSTEEARAKISAQKMSEADKYALANVMFCSLWAPEYTRSQVAKAWKSLLSRIQL